MLEDEGGSAKLKLFKLTLAAILLSSLPLNIEVFWVLKNGIAAGHGDFVIFYTGAEILKAGMGERLYDYETQKAFQDKLRDDRLGWRNGVRCVRGSGREAALCYLSGTYGQPTTIFLKPC